MPVVQGVQGGMPVERRHGQAQERGSADESTIAAARPVRDRPDRAFGAAWQRGSPGPGRRPGTRSRSTRPLSPAAGGGGGHPPRADPAVLRRRAPQERRLARRPPGDRRRSAGAEEVALFADTYAEPSRARDRRRGGRAARVLRLRGRARRGRLLPAAADLPRLPARRPKRDGEATLARPRRIPPPGHSTVVVCEPSCASALTDDLPDLIDDVELGERVASGVMMIDVFLERELAAGRPRGSAPPTRDCRATTKILIHGHCHQKALYGTAAMKRLLGAGRRGLEVAEVDSGCCGMAGAFGYEKEHYELSRRDRRGPAVPGDPRARRRHEIVACGFSCRHQIEHFTGRKARHWVEMVRGRT